MVLSSALAITMVYMYNNGEPDVKRVSNEFIIDRLNEIRDNKEHDELIKEISHHFTLIMNDAAPELSKKITAAVAAGVIPNDIFSIVDYMLTYDFTGAADLFSATMDSASKGFMINPDYSYGAQYVSIISSVSDVLSHVTPLSNNTATPEGTTLFGQTLYNLPMAFVNSLTEDVWKQTAEDCATLANRLYFTNFAGTYEGIYGTQEFDVNDSVKPAFSQIYNVCMTLANSPPISTSS